MFALGIIGIFQALILPGIIINKYVRFPKNFFFFVSSLIAFSLISNFIIVFFLTAIGLFIRPIILILLIIEIGFIIYLYRRELVELRLENVFTKTWNSIAKSIRSFFPEIQENENRFGKFLQYGLLLGCFVIAIIAIEWISRFFRYNIGEVFNTWDAVVSWNRWAVDWASNRLPLRTQDYPQLIPTNWAMIYQVIGTSQIQFFSKAIMPLFPLLILLILFGMGLETKNPGYFLAVEVTRLFMKKFSGDFIASGYVDFPLTFFVLLSIVMLYLAYKSKNLDDKLNYVFLSLIFVAGAVVTKQPGFYALLCILLISVFLVLRSDLKEIFNKYKKQTIIAISMIGIIIIPWFLYKGIEMIIGVETTHLLQPVVDTNQTHDNQSILSNLIPGLRSLGNYLYIALLIVPSIFIIDKFWRIIAVFVVLPYVFLWATYASYDLRNLTMMFPLIALLFCLGFVSLLEYLVLISGRLKLGKIPLNILFILLSVVIFLSIFFFPNELLEAKQIEKQKQIFSEELNSKLYEYFAENQMDGKILTNYPVDYLPGFENSRISFSFDDLNYMETRLFLEDVGYILYPTNVSGDIEEFLSDLENKNHLITIFQSETYIPYTFVILKE